MRYAVGYAWDLPEIFENFDSQALKIDGVSLDRLYGDRHKKIFCYKVFKECCKIIVNDIIENDVEFSLPTGSRKTFLRMRTYRDVAFRDARRNGKFMKVDFLKSNFSANQLQLYMYGHRNIPKAKQVYLNPALRDKIIDYTNEGRVYYGKVSKTIKDYYEIIQEKFPRIPITDLKKILNYGWKSLYLVNSYGGDSLVQDYTFWFYIGSLYRDSIKHFDYYKMKLCNKFRVMYNRHKIPWDGYYYFALTETQYRDYKNKLNKRGRPKTKFTFEKLFLYKLYDECSVARSGYKYLFKVKYPIDLGFKIYNEKITLKNIQFIKEREPLKFEDILVFNNEYSYI